MKYTCVFFDLDHTLWDYETNAEQTLQELYDQYKLQDRGVTSFEKFHGRFRDVNLQLWDLYDHGIITSEVIRRVRFRKVLEPFGAHERRLAEKLSADYLSICPTKGNVMPNAVKTLDYLATKYKLTIITNGFDEVQHLKVSSSKIGHFFDHVITSQKAGCKKPAKEIFQFALGLYAIEPEAAIMVGDNLITDMGGARNAAIDSVYYNPQLTGHYHKVNYEIKDLAELCSFL